jgi:hypothetical protein
MRGNAQRGGLTPFGDKLGQQALEELRAGKTRPFPE